MASIWLVPASIALSTALAHLFKALSHLYRENEWSWRVLLWNTGGMPSAHSATVSALATAIFLLEGNSSLFWISAVFALITIRDAFGVRQSVSDQAKLLNVLTGHLKLQKKVKIVLGHSPMQVGTGVVLGIAVALLLNVWL